MNLYPEKGKNERADAELKRQLAHIKGTLDKKQLYYLTEQTRKLKEFQETPSTQEELMKIPLLKLSDITREALPYRNKEMNIGGIPTVIHDYRTNGIVYLDFSLIPQNFQRTDSVRDPSGGAVPLCGYGALQL